MNEIQVGDRVRIKKPEDTNKWPSWNSEGEMDYLDGATIHVSDTVTCTDRKSGPCHWFYHDGWQIAADWCEKVEEMTLAQWEKMSPQERLEWNRPAFEALAGGIEYLNGDVWEPTTLLSITMPHRPKKKPADPPKELWVTFVPCLGSDIIASFTSEEALNAAYDDFMEHRPTGKVRTAKYVIAE